MPRTGLFLFLGPDRAGKLQRIHELERTLQVQALDRHELDGAVTSGADLLALCRQQPALSPVRLIVVDHAHRLDAACIEALIQHAKTITQMACVVLLVETELSVRHALSKESKAITVEQFEGRPVGTSKPFALTDALGQGNVAGALRAAHEQLMEGKEVFELFGLVAWQVQRWVAVKRLAGSGYSADQIAAVTGLRAWHVERLRSEVARRSQEILDRQLESCWKVQRDAKSGRAIPDLALEQLLVELCETGT